MEKMNFVWQQKCGPVYRNGVHVVIAFKMLDKVHFLLRTELRPELRSKTSTKLKGTISDSDLLALLYCWLPHWMIGEPQE